MSTIHTTTPCGAGSSSGGKDELTTPTATITTASATSGRPSSSSNASPRTIPSPVPPPNSALPETPAPKASPSRESVASIIKSITATASLRNSAPTGNKAEIFSETADKTIEKHRNSILLAKIFGDLEPLFSFATDESGATLPTSPSNTYKEPQETMTISSSPRGSVQSPTDGGAASGESLSQKSAESDNSCLETETKAQQSSLVKSRSSLSLKTKKTHQKEKRNSLSPSAALESLKILEGAFKDLSPNPSPAPVPVPGLDHLQFCNGGSSSEHDCSDVSTTATEHIANGSRDGRGSELDSQAIAQAAHKRLSSHQRQLLQNHEHNHGVVPAKNALDDSSEIKRNMPPSNGENTDADQKAQCPTAFHNKDGDASDAQNGVAGAAPAAGPSDALTTIPTELNYEQSPTLIQPEASLTPSSDATASLLIDSVSQMTTLEAIRELSATMPEGETDPETEIAASKVKIREGAQVDENQTLRYALRFLLGRVDLLTSELEDCNRRKEALQTELDTLKENVLAMLSSKPLLSRSSELEQINTHQHQKLKDVEGDESSATTTTRRQKNKQDITSSSQPFTELPTQDSYKDNCTLSTVSKAASASCSSTASSSSSSSRSGGGTTTGSAKPKTITAKSDEATSVLSSVSGADPSPEENPNPTLGAVPARGGVSISSLRKSRENPSSSSGVSYHYQNKNNGGSIKNSTVKKNGGGPEQRYVPRGHSQVGEEEKNLVQDDDDADDDDEGDLFDIVPVPKTRKKAQAEVSLTDFLNASRMSKSEIRLHDQLSSNTSATESGHITTSTPPTSFSSNSINSSKTSLSKKFSMTKRRSSNTISSLSNPRSNGAHTDTQRETNMGLKSKHSFNSVLSMNMPSKFSISSSVGTNAAKTSGNKVNMALLKEEESIIPGVL